jgi:hypothetical protein
MAAPPKRRDILKDVVPISSDRPRGAALPPEAAVINQRVRVVFTGLTGGCQLRAIRGGRWRRLTVIHGHSVTVTCAHSSIGAGPHDWKGCAQARSGLGLPWAHRRQLARFYRATTIQIDAPAFSVQDHRWQP